MLSHITAYRQVPRWNNINDVCVYICIHTHTHIYIYLYMYRRITGRVCTSEY